MFHENIKKFLISIQYHHFFKLPNNARGVIDLLSTFLVFGGGIKNLKLEKL